MKVVYIHYCYDDNFEMNFICIYDYVGLLKRCKNNIIYEYMYYDISLVLSLEFRLKIHFFDCFVVFLVNNVSLDF